MRICTSLSVFVLLIVSALAVVPMVRAAEPNLESVAMAFLDAYATGDWKTVRAGLSKHDVNVYGSDVSEFGIGEAGVKAMFDNDQKLWRGSGRFGAASQLSSVTSGRLAALFFNRVFEVGGQKMVVRFSTVWRLESGAWKLVQSSNVVPTKGHSAAEILGPNAN
jgi:SnoaL-like domain